MIALALLLAAAAASDCDRDDNTQSEMNACALESFNEADAGLNAQWKLTFQAFRKRSVEDAARLRDAQRAWIVYRDAECDAEYPFDLGVSLDKMLHIYCRTEMTVERTERLRALEKGI